MPESEDSKKNTSILTQLTIHNIGNKSNFIEKTSELPTEITKKQNNFTRTS